MCVLKREREGEGEREVEAERRPPTTYGCVVEKTDSEECVAPAVERVVLVSH